MSLFSVFKAAQTGDEEAVLMIYNMFLPKIKKCGRSLHYETSETDITIKFLEFIKARKAPPQIIYLDDENTFIRDIPYYDELTDLENSYFQCLTNLQKKIIILKYIHGFSDQEIANSLCISRQAVNRAKNRGISIIKAIYEDA